MITNILSSQIDERFKRINVLIVRFEGESEIFLSTSVINALYSTIPGVRIHYLCYKRFAGVLTKNPKIYKLHTIDRDLFEQIDELENAKLDYIFDLQDDERTHLLAAILRKPKTFIYDSLSFKTWLVTNLKINILPGIHLVKRFMNTVKDFVVDPEAYKPEIFIPDQDRVEANDIPISHIHGFIAVAMGAIYNTRKFPLHKWKELLASIHYPVIIIGGEEVREEAEELRSQDEIKIYNACGKFSFIELSDLVRRSKLLVSNDSVWIHIAAFYDKITLTIWGNTIPLLGLYPINNRNYDFQNTKLWCRPCTSKGFDACPLGHFKCMEDISSATILTQINSLLKI